jgi:D-tyrosyl-tRNA(Tyr) deacylase
MQFIDLATSLDICIVKDSIVSSIGGGLCLLVGISRDDTVDDVDYMYVHMRLKYSALTFCNRVNKVLGLRVFEDDNGKMWAKNVKDSNFEILSGMNFNITVYQCILRGI